MSKTIVGEPVRFAVAVGTEVETRAGMEKIKEKYEDDINLYFEKATIEKMEKYPELTASECRDVVEMPFVLSLVGLSGKAALKEIKTLGLLKKTKLPDLKTPHSGGSSKVEMVDADVKKVVDVKVKSDIEGKIEVTPLFKATAKQKDLITVAITKGDVEKIAGLYNEAGWNINKEALNKVPKHIKNAGAEIADNIDNLKNPRGGIKYDGHKGDKVRIMQENPKGQLSQQQDYVKIVSGGKMRDKFENEVKYGDNGFNNTGHNPRSHIPLSEWIEWKTWSKP